MVKLKWTEPPNHQSEPGEVRKNAANTNTQPNTVTPATRTTQSPPLFTRESSFNTGL